MPLFCLTEFRYIKQATNFEVELKKQCDFEVIIPNEAKGWVSHAFYKALRSETVLLDIAATKRIDNRSTRCNERIETSLKYIDINQEPNMGLIVTQISLNYLTKLQQLKWSES